MVWQNSSWRIVHTQVDYYDMLLDREFGNDAEAESKLDPNIVERKHQKLRRGEGLGEEVTEECWRGGVEGEASSSGTETCSRKNGDLSHSSTYKRNCQESQWLISVNTWYVQRRATEHGRRGLPCRSVSSSLGHCASSPAWICGKTKVREWRLRLRQSNCHWWIRSWRVPYRSG